MKCTECGSTYSWGQWTVDTIEVKSGRSSASGSIGIGGRDGIRNPRIQSGRTYFRNVKRVRCVKCYNSDSWIFKKKVVPPPARVVKPLSNFEKIKLVNVRRAQIESGLRWMRRHGYVGPELLANMDESTYNEVQSRWQYEQDHGGVEFVPANDPNMNSGFDLEADLDDKLGEAPKNIVGVDHTNPNRFGAVFVFLLLLFALFEYLSSM